ncbi:MAG: trehalose-phosphatase [Hyphomicrobiaceae bacterium]
MKATAFALDAIDEIAGRLSGHPRAVFLDYDGTLTPIAARPELAELSNDMRALLSRLSKSCPIAVITGRELTQIKRLVGLDIAYAASHGLELQLPGGPPQAIPMAAQCLPAIRSITDHFSEKLGHIPGLLVEVKPFSVAIHYRLVAENRIAALKADIRRQLDAHEGIEVLEGKKVYEFRPAVEWDKGQAVLFLARRLGIPKSGLLYLGDDVTDEDVFEALRPEGIGVRIADEPRATAAAYTLASQDDVARLLLQLAERLR